MSDRGGSRAGWARVGKAVPPKGSRAGRLPADACVLALRPPPVRAECVMPQLLSLSRRLGLSRGRRALLPPRACFSSEAGGSGVFGSVPQASPVCRGPLSAARRRFPGNRGPVRAPGSRSSVSARSLRSRGRGPVRVPGGQSGLQVRPRDLQVSAHRHVLKRISFRKLTR